MPAVVVRAVEGTLGGGGGGCRHGAIFPGVAQQTYDVPALAAGTYGFVCTVHPNMTGTLTVN